MFTKNLSLTPFSLSFFFDNKKKASYEKIWSPNKMLCMMGNHLMKGTVALFNCSTIALLHCWTVAQYCCCTLQLLDHCTVALLHHCTTPPLHSIAIALLNCCTIALLHCQTRLPQVLLSLWLSKQKTYINIDAFTHTWLFSVFFMGLWGYISAFCNLLKELQQFSFDCVLESRGKKIAQTLSLHLAIQKFV